MSGRESDPYSEILIRASGGDGGAQSMVLSSACAVTRDIRGLQRTDCMSQFCWVIVSSSWTVPVLLVIVKLIDKSS